MPVKDLLGSTLALVNSANAIATQYAYDPLGNSVMSGQNIAYPYQFAGMELDATGLYFNGRGYYDPAFGRALDGAGAPAAPGSGGMGAAAGLPSGSGGGGLSGYSAYLANGTAQEAIAAAAGLATYEAASSMSGAAFSEYALTAYIGSNGGEIGMAVAAVAIIVEAVLDAFGIDLFGGGQSVAIPPMYYRFDHYPAGPFIGAYPALFPNQTDSGPQMGRYILAQYVRGPEYRRPPQPEFRAVPPKQPAPRMDMGTCLALTSPAGLPAAIGCGITGVYCGSTLFGNPTGPASCSEALGWCGSTLGILGGCYAVGKGGAPQVNPDAAQTAPLERPYEVPPPEPAP